MFKQKKQPQEEQPTRKSAYALPPRGDYHEKSRKEPREDPNANRPSKRETFALGAFWATISIIAGYVTTLIVMGRA